MVALNVSLSLIVYSVLTMTPCGEESVATKLEESPFKAIYQDTVGVEDLKHFDDDAMVVQKEFQV